MVRFSSPVAHLLQGLMMCCALVDACLHTLVVRSGYFSCCCLPISMKQYIYSPLTSGIISSLQTPGNVFVGKSQSALCKVLRSVINNLQNSPKSP